MALAESPYDSSEKFVREAVKTEKRIPIAGSRALRPTSGNMNLRSSWQPAFAEENSRDALPANSGSSLRTNPDRKVRERTEGHMRFLVAGGVFSIFEFFLKFYFNVPDGRCEPLCTKENNVSVPCCSERLLFFKAAH